MTNKIDFSKYHHCISTMPLFQGFEVEIIKQMQEQIKELEFASGDFLYQADDQMNGLFLIQEGQVRIYRLSTSGKEQHIRVLEQGDFIGEMSLFQDQTYDRYAQALTPTKVCSMNRLDFKDVLLSNPQIALDLLAELAHRLDASEQQTTLITTEDVQTRLASYIFNEFYKQDTPRIKLESTKKNIASYLGMSAESFSRGLTKLTKMSVITQPASNIIEILDPNKIKKLTKN